MPHVYASVADLKDYLRDQGASDLGSANDALLLARLEAASRRVDEYCSRSLGERTGFGPRTGTNRYHGQGGSRLRLHDDLVVATTVTVRPSTASATTQTPIIDTDWYGEPDVVPYREIILHGQGTVTRFGTGYRVTDVLGTWGGPGYGTLSAVATVSSGLASGTTATQFIASASPPISPGHTLLIDSEQIYLRDLDGSSATVTRGQNGTTAATHADGTAIAIYTYDASVVDGTLQIALRRLRQRDAGLSGQYGGEGMPQTAQMASEQTILRATVGHLRLPTVY